MRPLLIAVMLGLALPGSASANEAFCTALRQVVQAAQSRFERHGTLQPPGGAPRGVFYAVMARHDPRQPPDPTAARFAALQHEVGQCLTDASFQGLNQGQGTAQASWQTQYAVIGLRRAEGGREMADSLVELSIASRW
jgi:hypothetical protein